jgi:spore coat polysaccharide biosynthesis protein SpsF
MSARGEATPPRVVGIVQARMNSTRLPGKVMAPIGGTPLLGRLLDRLAQCRLLDSVCVATTVHPIDAPVAELCRARGVACHRGSELDVLQRFHDAARTERAEVVVRITGDCPLLDPALVDAHVREFLDAHGVLDYLWCGDPPRLPNGMTCEVFTWAALDDAHRSATRDYDREHVTPYLRRPGSPLRVRAFSATRRYPALRLSVDTAEDLEVVRRVWDELRHLGPGFALEDIVQAFVRHPEWLVINAHVEQATGPHRPGGERL